MLAKLTVQQSKYHSTKTTVNGITFDSQKEARRYSELLILFESGKISDLRLQVNFTLQEGFTTHDGKRIKPIVYKADFAYCLDGQFIIEDVKGVKTKEYLMKKKMLRDKFGFDIMEV